MTKKILNEWRKFNLNEGPTRQDQELGAPMGWFTIWNDHMGMIDFLPEYQAVLSRFGPQLSELQKMASNKTLPKSEQAAAEKAYKSITSGFTYYSDNPKIQSLTIPMEEVVEIKLNYYFNDPSVPQEHKDFFSGNYERIMDYGKSTMMPNRAVWGTGATYGGNTGFKGSVQDFYMFGDGIDTTRSVMDSFFQNFDRAEPTEIPTEPEVDPELKARGEERAQGMADMFSRFFADNPPEPKRRRRK